MASSGSYALPQEPSDGRSAEVGEEEFGGNVEFNGAVVNVLNILSGVGLLSVPYALKKAGWAGLAVLWLLGIVTNYTGMVLLRVGEHPSISQGSPFCLVPSRPHQQSCERDLPLYKRERHKLPNQPV